MRKALSMSIGKKLLLAAFAAALLLALTGGTAGALRSLGFSQREIKLLFIELSFGSLFGGVVVICEVGLNTTLNSLRVTKREGSVVGRVTAVVLRCRRGTASVLEILLWNVKYRSILGTLPTIEGIQFQIETVQFLVEYGARLENRCLILADTEGIQDVVVEAGGRRKVEVLEGIPFRLVGIVVTRLAGLCPFLSEAIMQGTARPIGGPIFVELA